jgi:hypothetical protein
MSLKPDWRKGAAAGTRLTKAFGELAMTPQSQALRSIFFASTDVKDPEVAEPAPLRSLGVLGGGLMGGGIAFVSASKAIACAYQRH